MMIECPHCGKMVPVKGIGRKPLNIPVIFICDALKSHPTVAAAARALDYSRGYIYKTLKLAGRTVQGGRT